MSRRIHDLGLTNLDGLPATCRACIFWEVSGAPQGPRAGEEAAAAGRKEAWWQATQLEWGTPGKALYVDQRPVGYATFGPAEHFPRARQLGHVVSDDALLLAALWVAPEQRDTGGAKMLLQSVLRETHRRGAKALEAYAARGSGSGRQLTTCFIPEEFLLANGFEVRHQHADHPLLRLDLRKTVRWQESFGHALSGVVSALSRRERAPAPSAPALEAHR
ncbi:MAG: GNAT family N-acetyltransferase [Nitriliruptorales bacterium]|nr:GNAT family N-acetyltransferase [Nitriliruptorales bacterium]